MIVSSRLTCRVVASNAILYRHALTKTLAFQGQRSFQSLSQYQPKCLRLSAFQTPSSSLNWNNSFVRFASTKLVNLGSDMPLEKLHELDLDGAVVTEEMKKASADIKTIRLPHALYTREEMEAQESGHHVPQCLADTLAFWSVNFLRATFDFLTGYSWRRHTEKHLIRRVVFLETVAGIPGMIGALNRHLRSLRKIERDYGWIHTLLEEAENERMHLMVALLIMKPGALIKTGVLLTQAIFVSFYTLAYAVSPLYCHRFVGYLEEEAFKTYTGILNEIDSGHLPGFTAVAPTASSEYWGLPEGSTLRDIFLAIRADENHHRIMNHTFAAMGATGINPFPPGF